MTGMAEMIYMSRALPLVKKYGAVVVTPQYRLAGKYPNPFAPNGAPYPAALKDCYAALKYLKDHARELGINSSQIMVGGESAGGGLTAALCMYARDKGEVQIAFQMPLYPMLDDRDTPSSREQPRPGVEYPMEPSWLENLSGPALEKRTGSRLRCPGPADGLYRTASGIHLCGGY